jgi:hypothetical protein
MEEFDNKSENQSASQPESEVTPNEESQMPETVTEPTSQAEEVLMTWTSDRLVKSAGRIPYTLFAIAAVLIALGIWQHQYLLSVVAGFIVIFWFVMQGAKPGKTQVWLTTQGVKIDDKEWQYKDLGEFGINREVYPAALTIRHKSKLLPDLKFNLEGADAAEVEAVLSRYLAKGEGEDFRDNLIDKLGL